MAEESRDKSKRAVAEESRDKSKTAKPQERPGTTAAEAATKPSGGQIADRRQLEALRRKLREKFHTS